ncbi:hypothetical protein [Cupriavidus basilensis]|uniref:Uncharacterized protein n=1 Tax=Cupriavidus basilensis TaxID=68895 RepID=A0A0C4YN40_9BURK|nr:hypothetical protein [Cupriavidus basilensis]AJG24468.1 hypothetical protein RR42_s2887 [Cupriavidus basilensis]
MQRYDKRSHKARHAVPIASDGSEICRVCGVIGAREQPVKAG